MANKRKVIKEFKRIKDLGFIKSKRKNDTGIGKTFEDYLGVKENNSKDSDFEGYEVKSHRKSSKSLVTLFTKSPSTPKGVNNILREKFGRPEGKNKVRTLRTTIYSSKWNSYNNKYSFKIIVNKNAKTVDLLSKKKNSKKIVTECSWTFEDLKKGFAKLNSLFFVTAEKKKKRVHEYFHYTSATIFNKPSFNNFIQLIEKGKIVVDIRLGVYQSGKSKGKKHDHGTGFRIDPKNMKLLYKDVFEVS